MEERITLWLSLFLFPGQELLEELVPIDASCVFLKEIRGVVGTQQLEEDVFLGGEE